MLTTVASAHGTWLHLAQYTALGAQPRPRCGANISMRRSALLLHIICTPTCSISCCMIEASVTLIVASSLKCAAWFSSTSQHGNASPDRASHSALLLPFSIMMLTWWIERFLSSISTGNISRYGQGFCEIRCFSSCLMQLCIFAAKRLTRIIIQEDCAQQASLSARNCKAHKRFHCSDKVNASMNCRAISFILSMSSTK